MAPDRIFIVGYMGSGKTSGGQRLAGAMKWPFADTDAVLARTAGQSISALFESKGASGFRAAEQEVLKTLCARPGQCVVATGGGTPCHEDNMDIMLASGTVVYFKLSVEALVRRLSAKRKERPLIADIPEDELEAFVRRHLAQRERVYERANITVDADALDGQRLASLIGMIERLGGVSP